MSKLVQVTLTDTLMRYDNSFETHVQSGDRLSTWYFRVPDGWTGGAPGVLASHLLTTMDNLYNKSNERLRRAEPDDINHLAPLKVDNF